MNDNELDEILESIKNRKEEQTKSDETLHFRGTVEPPVRSARQEINPPVKIETPEPVVEAPKKEKAPKKAKKTDAPKNDKNKTSFGYGFNLKIAVVVAISIILAIAINFAIAYPTVGYLKSYEQKYGIVYPRGISKEFCDVYGANQSVVGKLHFDDLDKDAYISSSTVSKSGYVETGTNLDAHEQFRSMALSSAKADIESVYATAQGYENSTQQISFTDIFGKTKVYQVIAAYYVTTNPEDDNGYQFQYNLHGDLVESDFDNYKDKIETRSLYKTGYDMSYFDHYLNVSVDSDFMENFRFVITCVEVKKQATPITQTTENKSIHYPQIWYDKNNEHNPYWLANNWQPEIYTDESHTDTTKLN